MITGEKDTEIADRRKGVGRLGEIRALEYLRKRGYLIAVTNFSAAIGRNRKGVALKGEIDIVAIKSGEICFVEVKTRLAGGSAPEEAVTRRKQRQITRAAEAYLRHFKLNGMKIRFDVIAVIGRGEKAPRIQHYKNYWVADKFESNYSATTFA